VPYVEASVRRTQLVHAARTVLARDGVARTSLRAVAAEAGVPLGTMQYVFPSKDQLLRAVIEDVGREIADVLRVTAELDDGLEHAIRFGVSTFWARLVASHVGLQLMQYELTTYSLRTSGQEYLARLQYERYVAVVAEWCERAATLAGETSAVPFDRLARIIVASVDGLILQYISDADDERSREDLEAVIDMVVSLAGARRGA